MKKIFGILLCASMLIISSCGSDDDSATDTQNPTPPLNLIASSIGETTIQISWDASTDNESVAGYKVYLNDEILLENISETNATLTNLTPDTQYSIYVRAFDASDNISESSNTLNTTTILIDTEPPTSPQNLVITNSTTGTWSVSWEMATDNQAVTGYNVYVDGLLTQENLTGTSTDITSLTDYNQYSVYVTALDAEGNESEISNTLTCTFVGTPLEFKPTLSEMGIFSGDLADLNPSEGVENYELNTILYTDYAKKQRLVRLPNCQTMGHVDDLLPTFPNNSIVVKTFYYDLNETDNTENNKIIETRVMIKINGFWELGNYIWNDAQTEALFDTSLSPTIVPFSYVNESGANVNLNYEIPSMEQCTQCHHTFDGEIILIGPNLRNMNFVPSFTGQNQLDHFIEKGILTGIESSSEVGFMPNWEDTSANLSDRGRAYLDVNCAHCHSPGGEVPSFLFTDYRYQTPLEDAGIVVNIEEIKSRFNSTVFGFGMPLVGRTIIHEEGKELLFEYLDSL